MSWNRLWQGPGLVAALAATVVGCSSVPGSRAGAAGTASPAPAASTPVASRSAASPAARAPRCRSTQLKITLILGGAATSNVKGVIGFTNHGNAPCTLKGWPSLVAITAAGKTAAAAHAPGTYFWGTPGITTPRRVTIQPGARAEAEFKGSDLPVDSRCPPSYHRLRITPPGGTRASVISAWLPGLGGYLPACSPIQVSPVVPPIPAAS